MAVLALSLVACKTPHGGVPSVAVGADASTLGPVVTPSSLPPEEPVAWRAALPGDPVARRCALATHDFELYRAALDAGRVVDTITDLPFGRCFEGKLGTWALSPGVDDAHNVRAWVAIHVDSHEHVIKRARNTGTGAEPGELPPHSLFPSFGSVRAFDYDGDGDPELLVEAHGQGAGGGFPPDVGEGIILTARDGAIVLYAPAADLSIFAFKDVDGDGRPDIDTSSPYGGRRGGSFDEFGPALVAHSLPDGTFSMKDAVAEVAARRLCPKRPGPLVGLDSLRPSEREKRIACARMWGASKDVIARQLGLPGAADLSELQQTAPPLTLK